MSLRLETYPKLVLYFESFAHPCEELELEVKPLK